MIDDNTRNSSADPRRIARIRRTHAEAVAAYRAALPDRMAGVIAAQALITADRLADIARFTATTQDRADRLAWAMPADGVAPPYNPDRGSFDPRRAAVAAHRQARGAAEYAEATPWLPPCADCLDIGAVRLFAGRHKGADGLPRCTIHDGIASQDPSAPTKPCPGPLHRGEPVDRSEFHADARSRDGRHAVCKACRKASATAVAADSRSDAAAEAGARAANDGPLSYLSNEAFAREVSDWPLATLRWLAYLRTDVPGAMSLNRREALQALRLGSGNGEGPNMVAGYRRRKPRPGAMGGGN